MPLVTIIIPVYNTEKYLIKCLNSIVNQTYQNIEIIIVNDCSTDNSLKIINSYAKNYKNIHVINNPINLGISETRNIGLSNANGDYIYFIDSDDWMKNDAIEKLVNLILVYDSKIVECGFTSVFGKYITTKNHDTPEIVIEDYHKDPDKLYEKTAMVWNKLYSHQLIEKISFPKDLIFEDIAFSFPALTSAGQNIYTNEIMYYYRRHFNSLTLNSKLIPNDKIFDIFAVVEETKKRCVELGTYDEFKYVLEEILKVKSLIALMESNTWTQLSVKDHFRLLNLIYQYINGMYNMTDFANWKLVKERAQDSKIYNSRLELLKLQLKISKIYQIPSDAPLKDARRIISKYKSDY